MKNKLLISLAVALGLQCLTYTNGASADERTVGWMQPADETWGIGPRIVRTDTSQPSGQTDPSAMTLADLETAFWSCDYVATTRGVDATPIAVCTAVYDELKAVKFAGDFTELLAWWKENKTAEHQRIASEEREAPAKRVDTRF